MKERSFYVVTIKKGRHMVDVLLNRDSLDRFEGPKPTFISENINTGVRRLLLKPLSKGTDQDEEKAARDVFKVFSESKKPLSWEEIETKGFSIFINDDELKEVLK